MPKLGKPQDIVEGELAYSVDFAGCGKTLLCFFGGMRMGVGIPPFEFRRLTDTLVHDDLAKLAFFRDVEQAWYHGPLPGIGAGLSDLARHIDQLKAGSETQRLVCIGNSMGGYAALVVGSLASADRVIAISPQTFLTRGLRFLHRDRRWADRIGPARRQPSAIPSAFDLRTHLAEPGWGSAVVYAAKSERRDRPHIRRIADLPRLNVEWRDGGHHMVKTMRDNGELMQILRAAVIDAPD